MHGLDRVAWLLARHPNGPLAVPLTSRKQKVQRGMRNVYGIAGREQLPSVQKILATAAVQFALLHFFHRPPLPGYSPSKEPGRSPYHAPSPPLPHRAASGADRATGCRFVVASQRPPAGCIHPQRSNRKTAPFVFNAGRQQRSRQSGNAEGSRYQHDGGVAAFFPGCTADVKF